MKRLFSIFMAISICTVPIYGISAKSAILMDSLTGEILFKQNAEIKMPMASTTKIMTAITAIEEFDINKKIIIKKEYTLAEGSSMYLREGEELILSDLLYGLMLQSGNDAALAIAGMHTNFIDMMNQKAKDIGAKDTNFVNPNGLDDENHYTSAKDLALITRYALKNPLFSQIVSTKTKTVGERFMKNHNKMLWKYDGASGVKTGFTKKSGRCLVSSATRNGRELIVVTLNAPNDWQDHAELFDFGFKIYHKHTIDRYQGNIFVYGGEKNKIKISSTKLIDTSLRDGETIENKIFAKKIVYAPMKKGATYGIIKYYVGDTLIADDILVYEEDVNALPEKLGFFQKLLNYIKTKI